VGLLRLAPLYKLVIEPERQPISGVELLRPDAVGDESECSKYPDSGQNFEKVNEVTPDYASTYVYSTRRAGWDDDLYNLEDHAAGKGTIDKIKLSALCYGHDDSITYPGIYFNIKCGITEEVKEPDEGIALPTETWVWKTVEWTINPDTLLPFTWDDIDALQAGYLLCGSFHRDEGRVTQFYIEVYYTY